MIDRVQETWGTQRLLSFLFSVFAGLALIARHYRSLRIARLYHAQTRPRNRYSSRARRAPGPNPHPHSFPRNATCFSSVQPLVWSARSPSLTRSAKSSFSKSEASTREFILKSERCFSAPHSLPAGFRRAAPAESIPSWHCEWNKQQPNK